MARQKTAPIKGKSTRSKSKPQANIRKKRKKIAAAPVSKKRPSPPAKKKRSRRKKLKSLALGRVRKYSEGEPSKTKSTAEKAAILRKMIDLPFKAVSKFSEAQKNYIDKHYDGLDGAVALRRLVHLKKLKIKDEDKEMFEDSGYVVDKKSYTTRGKKKKGTYVLIQSPHPKAKFHKIKNGIVVKYLDRVEIIINLLTPEVYFMIEDPENFINLVMEENSRVFKKYAHLTPEYKLIYPFGESKHEYDDIENLHHYMQELEDEGHDDIIKRISGIAFIYHI